MLAYALVLFPLIPLLGLAAAGAEAIATSAISPAEVRGAANEPSITTQDPEIFGRSRRRRARDDDEFRPFLLPPHAGVAERVTAIDRAVENGDRELACQLLQKMIEECENEIHHEERPDETDGATYLGAVRFAEDYVLEGPEPLRRAYERLFGPDAESLLRQAEERADLEAMADTVRHFGATQAGARAAILLGDLALEEGDLPRALTFFRKAARHPELREDRELGLRVFIAASRSGETPTAPLPTLPKDLASADLGGESVAGDELRREGRRQTQLVTRRRHQEYPNVEVPTSLTVPPTIDERRIEKQWEFEFTEDSPFRTRRLRNNVRANVIPSVHRGIVLANDGMRAYGIDLFDGEPLWRSDVTQGMDALDYLRRVREGVNHEDLMAGAAANGIYVAPLLVDLDQHAQNYRQYQILVPIPFRRLHAFDAATGRLLWSHWTNEARPDGFALPFEHRAMVAAPPVIEGERIYCPMYILEARLKYYVACFDLRTGDRLWVRYVMTGQKEMNMFGNVTEAFAGSPLLVRDQKVFAVTNLGAIAALDPIDGSMLWLTTYSQLPLPKPEVRAQIRRQVWLNQPPALTRGTLLATPLDSDSLVAIDAANGRILESLAYDARHTTALNELVYADDDRVLVATSRQIQTWPHPAKRSFGKPRPRPFVDTIRPDADLERTLTKPRMGITESQIFVTDGDERHVFDLRSGDREYDPQSTQIAGNPDSNSIVVEGVLLLASNARLLAYFHRASLLSDIESRATSGDVLDRIRYARLLEREAGRLFRKPDVRGALDRLAKARTLLETDLDWPAARQTFARLVLLEADFHVEENRLEPAIASYERVLEITGEAQLRFRALRSLEVFLRRDERREDRYLDVLERLEREFRADPFEAAEGIVKTGAYVTWRRYQLARRHGDVAGQLEHLRRILMNYPDDRWEGDAGSARATTTIRDLIDIHGRTIYARYEDEARTLYERAKRTHNREELESIARRYPNAVITRFILLDLIESSAVANDTTHAVQAGRAALESGLPKTETLRRLAEAFLELGNTRLAEGIMTRLARRYPDEVSTHPADAGKTFAQLAPPKLPPGRAPGPDDPRRIGPTALRIDPVERLELVRPLGDDPARRVPGYLFLKLDRALTCYRVSPRPDGEPATLLWEHREPTQEASFDWTRRVIVQDDEVVTIADQEMVWRSLQSGVEVRRVHLDDPVARIAEPAVHVSQGVAVLMLQNARRPQQTVLAIDLGSGQELWRFLPKEPVPHQPIVSEGHVVLIAAPPLDERRTLDVLHLDLYTGWLEHRYHLDDESSLWKHMPGVIVGDRVFLWLRDRLTESRITCLSLVEETVAWNDIDPQLATMSGGGTLERLFAYEDALFGVVDTWDGSRNARVTRVLSIDPATGRARAISTLDVGDVIQGYPKGRIAQLTTPRLVVWHGMARGEVPRPQFSILDLSEERPGPRRRASEREAFALDDPYQTESMPPMLQTGKTDFIAFHGWTIPPAREFLRPFDAQSGRPLRVEIPVPDGIGFDWAVVGKALVVVTTPQVFVYHDQP